MSMQPQTPEEQIPDVTLLNTLVMTNIDPRVLRLLLSKRLTGSPPNEVFNAECHVHVAPEHDALLHELATRHGSEPPTYTAPGTANRMKVERFAPRCRRSAQRGDRRTQQQTATVRRAQLKR